MKFNCTGNSLLLQSSKWFADCPGRSRGMHWRSRLPLIPLCLPLCLYILFALTGCSLPQISAESRLFPAITIDFLDTYTLSVEGVDGWMAIAYDSSGTQATDPITYRLYAIAKGKDNTPQIQTLTLSLDTTDPTQPRFNQVAVPRTTPLLNEAGEPLTGDRFAPTWYGAFPR
ncbi:MAG: hypothetical protein HC925_01140 [Coleofasciculaceae cyanobacterium SM2_3_26]|nr:hypothetical protein [Coleofasciculaceae cyanobacterium SM2_3_26]